MNLKNLLDGNYIDWRITQLKCRYQEELRRFKNKFTNSKVALAGAFHETNLGDITLRKPFEDVLKRKNIKFSIQNLYRFNSYKKREFVIITGGATGVQDNVSILHRYYGDKPENVFMCGMDFSEVSNFRPENVAFLKRCNYISLRSKDQFEKLKKLGFSNISFAYDNAFALPHFSAKAKRTKVIGFNMLNLFMLWEDNAFKPGTPLLHQYKKNNPDAEKMILNIGPGYINLFNAMVNHYISKGYRVEHVPFAAEDDFFAKKTIVNNKVKFLKYSRHTKRVIQGISQYDRFYSTRFHATIFGFLSGTPTIPFIYSKKCNDLINDLQLNNDEFVWREEVVNSFVASQSKFLKHPGLLIPLDKLTHYRAVTQDGINKLINDISEKL